MGDSEVIIKEIGEKRTTRPQLLDAVMLTADKGLKATWPLAARIAAHLPANMWAPLLMIPLLTVFFWRVVVGGEIFWGQRDAITLFIPTKFFYWENLRQGALPLWNAHMGSGFPSFAEGHMEGLNPLKLPYFSLLPFPLAYNYSILTQLFLGGFFMWLYCRYIGCSKAASILAAIVFTFGGFTIVHIPHLTVISAIIWLPLVFYFIEKRFKEDRRAHLLWAGAALGLQLLGSHPGIMAIILMSYLLYIGFRSVGTRPLIPGLVVFAADSTALLLIGVAIGAVQLLPLAELSSLSVRSEPLPRFFVTYWSFPVPSLFTFFFPYFFGNDYSGDVFNGTYWGYGSTFQEATVYVGVLPVYLAVIRLLTRWDKYALCFFLLLLFSLVMALGRASPPYQLLSSLPGFDRLQAPGRFLILTSFSLAVLSGMGLDVLLSKSQPALQALYSKAVKIVAALIAIFLFLALYDMWDVTKQVLEFGTGMWGILFHFSRRITPLSLLLPLLIIFSVKTLVRLRCEGKISSAALPSLAIGVAFLDLFSFGSSYNLTTPPERFMKTPETVRLLDQDPGIYRIFTIPYRKHYAPRYLFEPGDLVGNSGLIYQVNNADMDTPISIKRHAQLLSSVSLERQDEYYYLRNSSIADMLNIKYLFSDHYLSNNELRLTHDDERVKIYTNTMALPRAYVARDFTVVQDPDEALDFLKSADFDPKKTVVLEKVPKVDTTFRSGSGPQVDIKQDDVQIVEYKNEEVTVRSTLLQPGLLVLTDAYYPGWSAYVDGQSTEILVANYAFRGVLVPAGEHTVTFLFRPGSVYLGSLITLAASILLIAVGVLFLVFNKRLPTPDPGSQHP